MSVKKLKVVLDYIQGEINIAFDMKGTIIVIAVILDLTSHLASSCISWSEKVTRLPKWPTSSSKLWQKARGAQARPQSFTFLFLSFIFCQILQNFGRVDYEKALLFGGGFGQWKSVAIWR